MGQFTPILLQVEAFRNNLFALVFLIYEEHGEGGGCNNMRKIAN